MIKKINNNLKDQLKSIKIIRKLNINPKILFRKEGVLPTFLIIGAQKSGTTSLHYYLNQHSLIFASPIQKEIHYFDSNYYRGVSWYKKYFPTKQDIARKSKNFHIFETSPYYLFHPAVPYRVHKTLPNVKLIIILRNPIDRAISHYWHSVKLNRETREFEEACLDELNQILDDNEEKKYFLNDYYFNINHLHYSYLRRGFYGSQIQKWFDFFDRKQFLFLRYEDFFSDPKSGLEKVFNFLECDMNGLETNLHFQKYNSGCYKSSINVNFRTRLEKIFEADNLLLEELTNGEIYF